jgi:hypothetical protein
MDGLFSQCTRYRDILEGQGGLERSRINLEQMQQMQELNLDVSTEEFLSAERAFTYTDLYAMIRNRNKIVWLTPHTAVVRNHGEAVIAWNQQLDEPCGFCFSADGKEMVALARSPEHLSEICDVVLRLLAASVVQSIILQNMYYAGYTSINAPTLAYLMEQCQSVKALKLIFLEMDEDHCRVLGGYSRPGLEIVLHCCKLTRAGASALVEILGRNQGPTKIAFCEIDNFVLTNGLRGNSHLKSLKPRFSRNLEVRDRQVLAIAGALRENKGLVDLDLQSSHSVNDETWGAICDSLETHPTLEVLDLRVICCTLTRKGARRIV